MREQAEARYWTYECVRLLLCGLVRSNEVQEAKDGDAR